LLSYAVRSFVTTGAILTIVNYFWSKPRDGFVADLDRSFTSAFDCGLAVSGLIIVLVDLLPLSFYDSNKVTVFFFSSFDWSRLPMISLRSRFGEVSGRYFDLDSGFFGYATFLAVEGLILPATVGLMVSGLTPGLGTFFACFCDALLSLGDP